VSCDDQNPCTGEGMTCLPAAKGGTVCKPSSCPACTTGTFCAYDDTTCQPTGCTSDACGFAYVGTCDTCVKANCCSQNLDCANDSGCAALAKCVTGCTTSSCESSCEQGASSTSITEFNAASSCTQQSCLAECYGSAGATPDAGVPGTCDILGSCVVVTSTSSPGDEYCGNNGGGGVGGYAEAPLGSSGATEAPWTGIVQPGGSAGFESCYPDIEPVARCVPAAQAGQCLGLDAGGATPPPTCATCTSYALPACPDPTSDPSAEGTTCCPTATPYFVCNGGGCSAAPSCCALACECTLSCTGG